MRPLGEEIRSFLKFRISLRRGDYFLPVSVFADYFSPAQMEKIAKDTRLLKGIPRPPGSRYSLPMRLNPWYGKGKNDAYDDDDRSQILLLMDKKNAWDFRLLVGDIWEEEI